MTRHGEPLTARHRQARVTGRLKEADGLNDDTESRTPDLALDRDDRSAVSSSGPAEVSQSAAREPARGVEVEASTVGQTKLEVCATMERAVERANPCQACQRVVRNTGAAGIDDLTIPEFKDWLAVD